MQCEEFEQRVNAVLDERGRPEQDAELRLHCETCPDCRHLAALYGALLDGFYALAAPEPPAEMGARVAAAMGPEPSIARRAGLSGAALAVAAVLLIAVVPLFRLRTAEEAKVAAIEDIAAQPPLPPAARQSSMPSLKSLPILQGFPALSDDPYEDLAKETGHGLATIALYVPGIGGTKGIIDVDSNSIDDEPAWASQMSEGLKPVTESVAETFNLLLRALPVTELASR